MGDSGRRVANVAVASEADADGTYDTDTADLINELKTQLNALIAALKDAQLMETS